MLRFANSVVLLGKTKDDQEVKLNGMNILQRNYFILKINKNKTKALNKFRWDRREDKNTIRIKIGVYRIPEVEDSSI